jgi:hypothetical protein
MNQVEAAMNPTGWHVPDEELRRYADRGLTPPWLWSAEAHLAACTGCRERLAEVVDPGLVRAGWARLDAELDAPRPGPLEAALLRIGVREHTARLLAATPVLRLSWLVAVASTLAFAAVSAHVARAMTVPILFLAVAPLLPLVGVAVSFGPGVDPTYELALVAPLHTFRLLMLRCAAVLTTTSLCSAAASLALPGYGLVVLGWLLPALALTLLCLALTPRLGPGRAAVGVGLGWVVLVASTVRFDTGQSSLFAPAGQVTVAIGAAAAAMAVWRVRPGFDTGRHLGHTARLRIRRMP